MSDDLTPAAELASAAFDGQVSEIERAQAESSAAVTAAMHFYGELREQLASVPVPASARAAALAAALAEFDSLHGSDSGDQPDGSDGAPVDAPSARGAAVIELHRRRQRQSRWLGGVAAAAVVTVLGIAVVRGTDSGDDKASTGGTLVNNAVATAKSVPESLDVATPTEQQDASATGGASADNTISSAADTTVGDSTTEDTTAELAQPSPLLATTGDPWLGATQLATTDQVADFARQPSFGIAASTAVSNDAATSESGVPQTSSPSGAATTTVAATETTATSDSSLAPTAASLDPDSGRSPYQLFATCLTQFDGVAQPAFYQGLRVVIIRDDALHQATVVDPTSCAVVAIVPLG